MLWACTSVLIDSCRPVPLPALLTTTTQFIVSAARETGGTGETRGDGGRDGWLRRREPRRARTAWRIIRGPVGGSGLFVFRCTTLAWSPIAVQDARQATIAGLGLGTPSSSVLAGDCNLPRVGRLPPPPVSICTALPGLSTPVRGVGSSFGVPRPAPGSLLSHRYPQRRPHRRPPSSFEPFFCWN